jgi:very-short-patch-repair endonuclease
MIGRLAARQYGVVARWQLLKMGFEPGAIDRMIAAGYLHPIHRGVYAVGHTSLGRGGRVMAAVLSYGPEALASHVAGAWCWGMLRGPGSRIDVTVPARGAHPRQGIRLHRPRNLFPEDIAKVEGIPCTSVARVLLDLAATHAHLLRRAFEESERKRVLHLQKVRMLLERARGHKGAPRLRALLQDVHAPPYDTRSETEDAFLELLREERIRPPDAMNVMIGEFEVDAVWWDERVVVEIDHYSTHGHRTAFERDRIRDAELAIARFTPIRITDAAIAERNGAASRFRRALG